MRETATDFFIAKTNMKFCATKYAPAYVELEHDTLVTVPVHLIKNVVAAPPHINIGNAIIFLADGTSINVVETEAHLQKLIANAIQYYFERGFSKN